MQGKTSDLKQEHGYLSEMPDFALQALFRGTIAELEKATARGERATVRSKKLLDLYCSLRDEQNRRPMARDYK